MLDSSIIIAYRNFIGDSVESLMPVIGMTAGIFLAFSIFDRITRMVRKTIR